MTDETERCMLDAIVSASDRKRPESRPMSEARPVSHYELDAKLELTETRLSAAMDVRISKIESTAESIRQIAEKILLDNAKIRAEMKTTREEMKAETEKIREEVKVETRTIREEMKTTREEMKAETEKIREEVKVETRTIREEMRATREEMKAETEKIREEMKVETRTIREEMRAETEKIRNDVKSEVQATVADNTKTRRTVVITGISSVIAIVIGIASFNSALLSNMIFAMESGKTMSATQAEVRRQIEETDRLLRSVREAYVAKSLETK